MQGRSHPGWGPSASVVEVARVQDAQRNLSYVIAEYDKGNIILTDDDADRRAARLTRNATLVFALTGIACVCPHQCIR